MKPFNPDACAEASLVAETTPEEFVRSAMAWHFSEETGTPFWLGLRLELDFDPLNDIRSYADLRRFPDVSDRLRQVTVCDLVPRGLAETQQPRVFESGGTTGAPKFMVGFDAWIEENVDWRVGPYIDRPGRPKGHTLGTVPTGPHIVGAINRRRAERLGGMFLTVDLDPRWVKRCLRNGAPEIAKGYTQHLVDQIEAVVLAQDIRFLVTTPPILRALMERPAVSERLAETLAQVTLGGTQIDIDEMVFIAETLLPGCEFSASYGSTSALGEAASRLIRSGDTQIEYRGFAPFITHDVIDPETGETVEYGARGTVVVSHLSRYAFYPRVVERDSAVRLPSPDGGPGDGLADIRPVARGQGVKPIEGVY